MDTNSTEYIKYRNAHEARVVRNVVPFMRCYDKAAALVFSGESKDDTIDRLAPWGCDSTQSNGTVAGACQAARLLKINPFNG